MQTHRRQSVAAHPYASEQLAIDISRKKRSHSMAPGEIVPNKRPSIAPRKSILKPSTVVNGEVSQETASDNTTVSMDVTGDFRTEVHDNISNKSNGRRVSFFKYAHVRVFEKEEENTGSSGRPGSSSPESSPHAPTTIPPKEPLPLSNENDYPGSRNNRARPSLTYSVNGEASMSMDIDDDHSFLPTQSAFSLGQDPSAVSIQQPAAYQPSVDDDIDTEDGSNDEDMEISEAIAPKIYRKRSLSQSMDKRASTSFRRRSSAQPKSDVPNADVDDDDDDDDDQPKEFTVPLSKALHKPRPPSEAWLALQAVTHSGVSTGESEASSDDDGQSQDMELTNALSRLERARMSLNLGQPSQIGEEVNQQEQNASFTSTDDSFDDGKFDYGDQTLNITNLLGSVRGMDISDDNVDAENLRDAMGLDFAGSHQTERADSQIEKSSMSMPVRVSANIFSAPPSASPATSTKPTSIPEMLANQGTASVSIVPLPTLAFHAPASVSAPSPGKQTPTENQKPGNSPEKLEALKPGFSGKTQQKSPRPAARTPLVTMTKTIPSPRKSVSPQKKKRPAPSPNEDEQGVNVSPAKKRILASGSSTPTAIKLTSGIPFSSTKNRANLPISPAPAIPEGKKAIPVRRPSGYFAQRKSKATGEADYISSTTPATVAGSQRLHSSVNTIVAPSHFSSVSANDEQNIIPEVPKSVEVTVPSPDNTTRPPSGSGSAGPEDAELSDHTEQWRSTVQAEEFVEELDDEPLISIEQFFMMTGVKFMDELTIPRRSTIHPSQLQNRTRAVDDVPSLAEFMIAMSVTVPQLELYSWAAKDVQSWIEKSKDNYQQAEEEAAKMTPGLFREFSQANEEGRSELLHQLKLIKAHNHSTARSQWYDWKFQWVTSLCEMADKGYTDLEMDMAAITGTISRSEELLPALRQQHAQILHELEEERAEIAEIENSDPDYLEELKGTIAEQNAALESYRADITEGNAKLERLSEKLAEVEGQKGENIDVIEGAQRMILLQKNSTRAEVFRLKDELESLQALHLWEATKIQPDLIEFIYDSCYRVTIPCLKFRPIASDVEVVSFGGHQEKHHEPFPILNDFIVCKARKHASNSGVVTTKRIVERLGDFWASCAQLRSQLIFLGIKYPLSLSIVVSGTDEPEGLRVTATVLFHKPKAKAHITYVFSEETIAFWPMSIHSMNCDVEIVYGAIDRDIIRNAVLKRLHQANIDDNYACLMDACVEATTQYE